MLSDIHVDIMDYIKPAYCNEAQFRSMWGEFEWENRVNVTTDIKWVPGAGSEPHYRVANEPPFLRDLRLYLSHIMKSTNMGCLTPDAALEGDCDFLSANLYARSVFGEDALANLSIERMGDTGTIQGHVRIRSKTQGIALSLGDKITLGKHVAYWVIRDRSRLTFETMRSAKRCGQGRFAIDLSPTFSLAPCSPTTVFRDELDYYWRWTERRPIRPRLSTTQ